MENLKEKINQYSQDCGEEINPVYADRIYEFLLSIRYLKDEFFYAPDDLLKDLFKENLKNSVFYYPCDILELRSIIKYKKTFDKKPYCFLSLD